MLVPPQPLRVTQGRTERPVHLRGLYDWVPWREHLRRLAWHQGEHVLVVGPTGQGKTTLIGELLGLGYRRNVLIFGTKTKDSTYNELMARHGLSRQDDWPIPGHCSRAMLWPQSKDGSIRATMRHQREVFSRALDGAWHQGGWTLVLDEEHWMSEMLKLDQEIAALHHQGRSAGLTLVDGIQRPAWVPVITYGSASHAYLWGTREQSDLTRLANLGGVSTRELIPNLASLGRYEMVYVPTRTGIDPVRTKVDLR